MGNRPHIDAPILDPQHGTEGCADTSDDSSELGEGGFIACTLVFACVAVAVLAAYLQWGGA
jgi:hypothetical protein